MKIIKGDKVKVLIGKDKNREAEVIAVFAKKGTLTVKGLNLFKRHHKGTQKQPGTIVEKERPLLASKVALICPSCHQITRVGYQIDKQGDKYRICRKCKNLISVKAVK